MSDRPNDSKQFWYMSVTAHTDDNGTTIKPAFDPDWDALRKLAWKAGVVQAQTGLNAKVGEATYTVNGVPQGGVFDVLIGRTLYGACSYQSAWDTLSGAETGHQEAGR